MNPMNLIKRLQKFGLLGGTLLLAFLGLIVFGLLLAALTLTENRGGLQIETVVAGLLLLLLLVIPLAYLLMAALFHLEETQIDLVRQAAQIDYLRKMTSGQSPTEKDQLIRDLNSFAQTVAHDLKTPLTTILGFATMLSDHQANIPPDQQREALQAIVKTSLKMNNIIQELLLLAAVRQATVKTGPIAMGNVVNAVRQRLMSLLAEAGAELSVPEPAAWPKTIGYAPWVEEIWINYLSNAIKYGGRPPRVELGVDLLEPQAPGERGMARFWVKDNGRGIAPEDVPQLFNQFTRLDQMRAEGHGLGLSIVARIIETLGGEVGVETSLGEGSRFYFTLPLVLAEPTTRARAKVGLKPKA
jgi:signal transduction histidine kinase